MSAPLRWGCSGLGRGHAEKNTAGDRYFFDWDYTRARRQPRLEICIGQIRFSDSLSVSLPGKFPGCLPSALGWGAPTPHRQFSERLFLPPGAAIV
jgi:hypothetical protein